MENRVKSVIIDIEVLRDWYSSLIGVYVKQIGDFEGDITGVEPKDLWEHFKMPVYKETILSKDEDGSEYDGFVETKYEQDLMAEYQIDQKLFNQFILDNVLEIFGHAKERDINTISFLNEAQRLDPNLRIEIVSTSKGKAKPATLFFLSKYSCEVNTIRFTEVYKDSDNQGWNYIDQDYINKNGAIKDLDFKNFK